ncbi:DNA-3-methyladenine glycosylase I [Williamsia maris]|uniref:DNA-3-methyladenine glycosylase I n=1 Tax=Williamsia maris TaxID=72806 RepID=A0ABT1HGI3_9NOCA|nr:DNA-3-methyladenine glycosylase I [Williamsia maris]MCP2176100.1 DNA-3-methyladenine glycosylase I [Williamsia maris]
MADTAPGTVLCEDGLLRPVWGSEPGMMRDYYDTEWGMPVDGENAHFERLSLEGFQAGLSWSIILRKRPAFREVFCDFDVDTVAAFTDDDVERLVVDARIVRNRAKIEATIGNARATQALRDDGGLVELLWSFRPETTPLPVTFADVPTVSAESTAMSKELRRKGFRFVGPTTMFALMEAVGIVDTHLVDSFRRGSSEVWAPDGTPVA